MFKAANIYMHYCVWKYMMPVYCYFLGLAFIILSRSLSIRIIRSSSFSGIAVLRFIPIGSWRLLCADDDRAISGRLPVCRPLRDLSLEGGAIGDKCSCDEEEAWSLSLAHLRLGLFAVCEYVFREGWEFCLLECPGRDLLLRGGDGPPRSTISCGEPGLYVSSNDRIPGFWATGGGFRLGVCFSMLVSGKGRTSSIPLGLRLQREKTINGVNIMLPPSGVSISY